MMMVVMKMKILLMNAWDACMVNRWWCQGWSMLVNMYVINIKSRAYMKFMLSIDKQMMINTLSGLLNINKIILTLFWASLFAFLSSSSLTTAKWPLQLATRSGVSPSYSLSYCIINLCVLMHPQPHHHHHIIMNICCMFNMYK